MLAPAVDERGDGFALKNVQASTQKRKATGGEVTNRWCEVESTVKPRFDGVLIGRFHVRQMAGLKGTQVGIDGSGDERVLRLR